MFELYADKTDLAVRRREPLVSGSMNIYPVRLAFSDDWDGLTRTAAFRAGGNIASVLLGETGCECQIPWEVLDTPGQMLYMGAFGVREGETVLPTTWAELGVVREGATVGEQARPPTPGPYEQVLGELGGKADGLRIDGAELSLLAGERAVSRVVLPSGGGGSVLYRFGHGLKQDGITVSVDAVDGFDGDNTLPITAAAVQSSIGNIEALLGTI